MEVAPGSIAVWSDIGCPWAHAAVWRLHDARRRLGLTGRVRFDHRAFPLELFNSRPTPRMTLDSEIPVVGALAPQAGWQVWQGRLDQYPVTTLLAMEAVRAAKEQSPEASEELDRGLRLALFGESRCISMRHVILEVASECDSIDLGALAAALDDGRARHAIFADWEAAKRGGVEGSPHLFLADGTNAHNPGVQMHWVDGHGEGFPVIDADDPSVYDDLLPRATRSSLQSETIR